MRRLRAAAVAGSSRRHLPRRSTRSSTKYQQALGGKDALAKPTTRVLTGTVTTRDLQTSNVTVKETAGRTAIGSTSRPSPILPSGSSTARRDGRSGGFNNQVRDLEGFGFQQAARLADFGLPLHLTDRYEVAGREPLRQRRRQGDDPGDGPPLSRASPSSCSSIASRACCCAASSRPPRRSGRCLSRSTTATIATSSGVKVPFHVRYVTWNAVTTREADRREVQRAGRRRRSSPSRPAPPR